MKELKNYNLFVAHKSCDVAPCAEEKNKYKLVEAKKQKNIMLDHICFDVKKATDKYIVLKLSTFASRWSKAKSYIQYVFNGENLTIEESTEVVISKYIFCYGSSYNKEYLEKLEKIENAKIIDKIKNTIKSIDDKTCKSIDIIKLVNFIGTDVDYNKGNKIKQILEKDINTLNTEEVITYLTFIYRKDYFDGHDFVTNRYLEDGTIKKLLERYLELC